MPQTFPMSWLMLSIITIMMYSFSNKKSGMSKDTNTKSVLEVTNLTWSWN